MVRALSKMVDLYAVRCCWLVHQTSSFPPRRRRRRRAFEFELKNRADLSSYGNSTIILLLLYSTPSPLLSRDTIAIALGSGAKSSKHMIDSLSHTILSLFISLYFSLSLSLSHYSLSLLIISLFISLSFSIFSISLSLLYSLLFLSLSLSLHFSLHKPTDEVASV